MSSIPMPAGAPMAAPSPALLKLRATLDALLPALAALALTVLLFSLAVALAGFNPLEVWGLIVQGGFGDAFAVAAIDVFERLGGLQMQPLAPPGRQIFVKHVAQCRQRRAPGEAIRRPVHCFPVMKTVCNRLAYLCSLLFPQNQLLRFQQLQQQAGALHFQ